MINKNDIYKFINAVPDTLEIVNTGSTFAMYGFDYKYFGNKKGFNFALAPQSLNYDYKILNQYQRHINRGALVVVVVCPFALCVDEYENDDNNYKYYFFLDKNCINNYAKFKEILIKYYPGILRPKFIVSGIKKILKKIIYYKNHEKEKNVKLENHIKQTANERICGWKNQFNLPNTTDCEPDEKLKKVFEKTTADLHKILTLCIENDFRTVIINMPVCTEESREFSNEFIERFYSENIKKANVYNVPVINYFQDNRFHDHSLYMNADCFNDKGREYFAKIFTEDLKKLDLWKE